MNKWIAVTLLLLGSANDVFAKPRPRLVSADVPFTVNYSIGQPAETTIQLPIEKNSAGTIYNIKYEISGVDSFTGTVNYPSTPDGAVVGSQTFSLGIDVSTQNGAPINWSDTWSDACESEVPGVPCSALTEPADYSEPFQLGPFEWNPAINGKLEQFGGPIKITFSTSASPVTYISGSGTLSGTLRITYTLDDKSAREYALEILAEVRGYTQDGTMEQAREFYRRAINHRENLGAVSYPGASINENLREVEYFGRGYQGGKLQFEGFWHNIEFADFKNDYFNGIIPTSYPAYNWLKEKGIIGAENENPISAPTESKAPNTGWILGVSGWSLDRAVDSYFKDNGGVPPTLPPPLHPAARNSLAALNNPEVSVARRLPSALLIDTQSAFPLDLFILSSNRTSIVQVPLNTPSDFLVVISGDPASFMTIENKDGIQDPFNIELENATNSVSEGASIVLPPPVEGAQVFALRGVNPDLGRVTMSFSSATTTNTTLVGVIPLASAPLVELAATRGSVRTRLGVSHTANQIVVFLTGPSKARPKLQSSVDLSTWTTIQELASFAGDAWVPLELSTSVTRTFFQIIE